MQYVLSIFESKTFIAIISIVIGAMLTYIFTRRNIISQRIFDSRQDWIDNIGDLVSKFYSLAIRIYTDHKRKPLPKDVDDVGNRLEVVRIHNRLKLKLNPYEPSHMEIEQYLDKIISAINNNELDNEPSKDAMDNLISRTRVMLKQEWEKTKKGK